MTLPPRERTSPRRRCTTRERSSPATSCAALSNGRVEHDLREAVAVAQIDEDAAAVIAVGLDPADQHDVLAGVGGAELAAAMGPGMGRQERAHGTGTIAYARRPGAIPAYIWFSQVVAIRSDP